MKMEKIDKGILREILSDEKFWVLGTPRKPQSPQLRVDTIFDALFHTKEDMYIDQVVMPHYHRFTKKLYALSSKQFQESHFELIDEEYYFSGNCYDCQMDMDRKLDRVLYRYRQANPHWIVREFEYTVDDLVEIVKEFSLVPTHQISLL